MEESSTADNPSISEYEYSIFEDFGYDNIPIIMKVRNQNFIVERDEDTQMQTIKISPGYAREIDVKTGEKRQVLIPKPDVIDKLYTL